MVLFRSRSPRSRLASRTPLTLPAMGWLSFGSKGILPNSGSGATDMRLFFIAQEMYLF